MASLVTALRALSLGSRISASATATTRRLAPQTARHFSTVLAPRQILFPRIAARPSACADAEAAVSQRRGMKVHSSIKKRCEHCKIVRRKAGKRHAGYRYVICKANPRHKQRQG